MLVMWQQKKLPRQLPISKFPTLYTLHSVTVDPIQLIMETPNTKSAQKYMKSSSQTAVPASARVVRSSSPEQQPKNNSSVLQKPLAKENTKPVEIKLHTQQRAVKRAIFNYSVATKLYLMEQQKKQVEKLQKMIEEEEVRLLRKEMIPRAQLMPLFDRPFFPQRSTRPLTVPRQPSLRIMSGKCSSCFSGCDSYSFQHSEAH